MEPLSQNGVKHRTSSRSNQLTIPEIDPAFFNAGASFKENIKNTTQICLYLKVHGTALQNINLMGLRLDYTLIHLDSNITSLNLMDCIDVNDDTFEQLKRFTKLNHLNLSWCDEITDEGLQNYLPFAENLTRLDLSCCNGITNAGIRPLQMLKNLTQLDLSDNSNITDDGVGHLITIANLNNLNLEGLKKITNVSLQYLCQLTNLSTLNLKGLTKITNEGLKHLGQLTNLTNLNLSANDKITDKGIAHLKTLTKLIGLDLLRCTQVSENVIDHLKEFTMLDTLKLSILLEWDFSVPMNFQKAKQVETFMKLKINAIGNHFLKTLPNLSELNISECKSKYRIPSQFRTRDMDKLNFEFKKN